MAMTTLNTDMDYSVRDTPRDHDLSNILFQHGKTNPWLYDVLQELQGLRNERKSLDDKVETLETQLEDVGGDLNLVKTTLFQAYGDTHNQLQNAHNELGKKISAMRQSIVEVANAVQMTDDELDNG